VVAADVVNLPVIRFTDRNKNLDIVPPGVSSVPYSGEGKELAAKLNEEISTRSPEENEQLPEGWQVGEEKPSPEIYPDIDTNVPNINISRYPMLQQYNIEEVQNAMRDLDYAGPLTDVQIQNIQSHIEQQKNQGVWQQQYKTPPVAPPVPGEPAVQKNEGKSMFTKVDQDGKMTRAQLQTSILKVANELDQRGFQRLANKFDDLLERLANIKDA